jgi:hypothetical protein
METPESLVKTRQQIAREYGISVKTLNRRLAKVNIVIERGILFPKTLSEIYASLGVPKSSKKSEKV